MSLLFDGATSKFHFASGNAAAAYVDSVSNAHAAGTWYYIVGVADGTTDHIYVNDTDENPVVRANAIDAGLNFRVGRYPFAGCTRYFWGDIANVQLYSVALTPAQIATNCNALKSRFAESVCN